MEKRIIHVTKKITTRPDIGVLGATLSQSDRRYLLNSMIKGLPVDISLGKAVFPLKIAKLENFAGDFERNKDLPIFICYDQSKNKVP